MFSAVVAPAETAEASEGAGAPTPLLVRLRRGLRRRAGVALLAPTAAFLAQFVALMAVGTLVWHRFTLGLDFAEYSQAFSSIGTGHLAPTCTIYGIPCVRSHFELIMWPLSLLYAVFRTSYLLLVVQAASIAGAGAAAYFWVAAWIREAGIDRRAGILLRTAVVVMLVANPFAYGSEAQDFHLEATAALFAVLTAYALWRRAVPWAVGFAAAGLLCGDIGGLYLIGVGLSGLLAGRRTWRLGAVFVVAGVVWIGLIGHVGADKGSQIDQYAYLAGRATLPAGFGAATVVLGGLLGHPGRALHVLGSRFRYFDLYLRTGGWLGIATAWGFGLPALVLLSSGLQHSTLFITQPFQQFAVTPFVAVGTAMLLGSLALAREPAVVRGVAAVRALWSERRWRVGRVGLAVVLAVAATAEAVNVSRQQTRPAIKHNSVAGIIPAGEAAELRSVLARIPGDAEVIVSLPISGRFGARRYVYLFDRPGSPIPLRSRTVVMVLDLVHTIQLASPAQDAAALAKVLQSYGGQLIASHPDLFAVEWHPDRTGGSVVLP